MSTLTTEEILAILSSDYDFNNCIVNCSNNGLCKYTGNKMFSCECYADYAGQTCQKNIRPCSHWPCLNNGTCVENIMNQSYTCECGPLYYGKNCENKIDVCENETCSAKGKCYDIGNVAVCKCYSLYSGTHCEIESSHKSTIQSVTSYSSIIAMVLLVFFFSFFIIIDVLGWIFISRERARLNRMKRYGTKQFKKPEYIPWYMFYDLLYTII